MYMFNSKVALLVVAVWVGSCLTACKEVENTTAKADNTEVADTTTKADETADTILAAPVKDVVAVRKPLILSITKLTSETAPIMIGVYGTRNKFPDPKDQLREYSFTPNGKTYIAELRDLPFGTYALALYQDVNSNGKIDKNLLGIPTEVYAFSNNYKPLVKAPAFKNCQFSYNEKSDTLSIQMLK